VDVFTAASHHDVLVLVVQIALLLISARVLGVVAQRLGQPAVVGEILSGVLLGPSLLSGVFPVLGHWAVPQTEVQGYLLEVVSLLGAMFLLLITGLETDLPLIRRHAKTAVGVAAGGLVLPFASGFVMALYLPDFLLASPERRLTFALFVATALSISAIPVIAKVLIDLNLMRRDIGQTIMAAGMVDDTSAWILLSIVLGLASGEAVTAGSVLFAAGKILVFMALSFTLGRWLLSHALNFVQDRVEAPDKLLTLVVAAAFVWGAAAQAIEIEAVLGAFVVGILFGTMRRLPEEVVHKLESMALGVFAPIFFAVAGLKVNIPALLSPQLLAITGVVLAVAVFGKLGGAYLGARLVGLDHARAFAFGSALNARGAVEIIIATIGLSLGVLSQNMYSIIVLMAVATSLMAPAMLRRALQHVTPDEEEARRLRQEELAEGSLVAHINRVLLPVRLRSGNGGRTLQTVETHLLRKLGAGTAVTLLNVAPEGARAEGAAYLDFLSKDLQGSVISKKVVEDDSPVEAILDEARKDYDLIILGASEKVSGSDVVFNPVTDQIMRRAPCPSLIVKGREVEGHWPPRRILVPTNGSTASRNAAEVAFSLAKGEKVQVKLLDVVEETGRRGHRYDAARRRQFSNAARAVSALQELGELQGVSPTTEVRVGPHPEAVILEVARKQRVDLIILGTDLHAGPDLVFLGSRVEAILDEAPCPVIIVNSSSGQPVMQVAPSVPEEAHRGSAALA
jgi:Kef-type K+ transport system membrane component KefB